MLQGEDIGMIRSQAERRGGAVDEKKPAAKSMMDVLRETDPKMQESKNVLPYDINRKVYDFSLFIQDFNLLAEYPFRPGW
jgi:hypothetical protein